ncbi:MAG: hypothetical protein SFU86_11765 [Pirellulaceae bacterium]|nr:hypothetical protein [Pirellulaceae bacterium]
MIAVEFETQVTDGKIEIPPAHRDALRGSVRVIVLSNPRQPGPSLIDELLANPLPIPNFQPLTRDEAHERG